MCRAFGEHGYSSRITTSNIIAFNRFHARNSSKCNTSQRWRFKHKIFHVCIPSVYANEWVQSMASTFKTKCTIHTRTHTSALARMYSPFFHFLSKESVHWMMRNTERRMPNCSYMPRTAHTHTHSPTCIFTFTQIEYSKHFHEMISN